jgi:NOL1/NOP2/fmu family ribosome biogenesis protein
VEGEGYYLSALQKNEEDLGRSDRSKKLKTKGLNKASKRDTALWRPYLKNADAFHIYLNEAGTYFAIPDEVLDTYLSVLMKLPHGSPSLILGQIKGEDIVPHHSLALSRNVSDKLPRISMSVEEAVAYMRKELPPNLKGEKLGWHLASSDGYLLGWLKQTSRHLKNYFPTNLRIRKRK